jgi:hypothetical protein
VELSLPDMPFWAWGAIRACARGRRQALPSPLMAMLYLEGENPDTASETAAKGSWSCDKSNPRSLRSTVMRPCQVPQCCISLSGFSPS